MRCFRRGILTAAGLSVGLTLAGCGSFDQTDWFSNKKPLPGDRKLVFPEGVPGVPQGIPQEMVKGNEPAGDSAAVAATPAQGGEAAAAAAAKPEPAAKPKPRVASRPKPAQARAPARPAAQPPERQPAQVTVPPTSEPAPQQQPASQNSSVWGAPPGQAQSTAAPWPAPATERAPSAPWPDAPSPNQFSR